jgi:hypothetical protein
MQNSGCLDQKCPDTATPSLSQPLQNLHTIWSNEIQGITDSKDNNDKNVII